MQKTFFSGVTMSELNAPNFDKAWTRLQVWFATDTETTSSLPAPKLLYLNPCDEL